MSSKTNIEWADVTWNPVTGCSHAGTPGCDNCYAVRVSHRLDGMGQERYKGLTVFASKGRHFNGEVRCHEDVLTQPFAWQRGAKRFFAKHGRQRRVFVNSMADLYHPKVPDRFIDKVKAVEALCPDVIFMELTKRPGRMAEYLAGCEAYEDDDKILGDTGIGNIINGIPYYLLDECKEKPGGNDKWKWIGHETAEDHGCDPGCGVAVPGYWEYSEYPRPILVHWPLSNVWLGASCENQAELNGRVHYLLKCPAVVRFLSCEPLLGELNSKCRLEGIHWVIVGGESGPGARPMNLDWVRDIRDQCAAARVPFFFKQWGEWTPILETGGKLVGSGEGKGKSHIFRSDSGGVLMARVGKKKAGRILDGRTHDAMPEVAR